MIKNIFFSVSFNNYLNIYYKFGANNRLMNNIFLQGACSLVWGDTCVNEYVQRADESGPVLSSVKPPVTCDYLNCK